MQSEHNQTSPTSFFFFPTPSHHRDLHSFPTRRSSDLRSPVSVALHPHQPRLWRSRVRVGEHAIGRDRIDRKSTTSELQSPCNLVCRLLLEKKKSAFRAIALVPSLPRILSGPEPTIAVS